MNQEDEFLLLIRKLYESVSPNGGGWIPFLELLADIQKGPASILIRNVQASAGQISAMTGIDESLMAEYNEYFHKVDPWIDPRTFLTGLAFSSDSLVSDGALEETEFYQDFLKRTGTFHQSVLVIAKQEQLFAGISLIRPRKYGAFGEMDLALLRRLHPHMEQALRLHRELGLWKERATATERAADLLPVGILLLDRQARLLWANRAADGFVRRQDGLVVEKGILGAVVPVQTRKLHQMVSEAAGTAEAVGTGSGGVMKVLRGGAKAPFNLVVAPLLPEQASGFGAGRARVAVLVSDPNREAPPIGKLLGPLFEFTPAEAKVAEMLMEGKSLEEIADEAGVSKNTVRTQMRQLMEKTGTHRQGELIALLWRSVAGWREV